MMFQRKSTHEYIGRVWADPKNRHDKREEDHNLYRDSADDSYIVVSQVEHVSGPNVSCSHTVYSRSDYEAANPTLADTITRLIADYSPASS